MKHHTATRKPVRGIFFDLDGTLVSFQTHSVPQSAVDALRLAKEQGILLFVATGRHMNSIRKIPGLDELGFSGYVTMNGQYCFSGERVVYTNPIDREDIRLLLDILESRPIPCLFLEADRTYINYIDPMVEAAHKLVSLPLPAVEDVRQALNREIYQVCIYAEDADAMEVVAGLRSCRAAKWHTGGIDVVPTTGNKWIGMQRMMEAFHLAPEEVAAFGDGENDIEMLTASGYSVAMGDAPQEVQRLAQFVTKGVDYNGIQFAFGNYLSIR